MKAGNKKLWAAVMAGACLGGLAGSLFRVLSPESGLSKVSVRKLLAPVAPSSARHQEFFARIGPAAANFSLAALLENLRNDADRIRDLGIREFTQLLRSKRTAAERNEIWRIRLAGITAENLRENITLLRDPLCPRFGPLELCANALRTFGDGAVTALRDAGADWGLVGTLLRDETQKGAVWVEAVKKAHPAGLSGGDLAAVIRGAGAGVHPSNVEAFGNFIGRELAATGAVPQGLAGALRASGLPTVLAAWNVMPVHPGLEKIMETTVADLLANGTGEQRGGAGADWMRTLSSLRPEVGMRVLEGISSRNAATLAPGAALDRALAITDPALKSYAVFRTADLFLRGRGPEMTSFLNANPALRDDPGVRRALLENTVRDSTRR